MTNRSRSSLDWIQALRVASVFLGAVIIGCGGGGSSSSPYGSTLVVKYYSDSECGSELPTAGSRFAITSSGETSCNQHKSYRNVALSFDPAAVSCDPANSKSCAIKDSASVAWRGTCDSSCGSCQDSTPSDTSYALGECIPVSKTVSDAESKSDSGTYLKVTTSGYTGALYLGVSEGSGSSIKMYDPVTMDSVYLDKSGDSNHYPLTLAVSESDLSNGYSNVLYSVIWGGNNPFILWQCFDTQQNSCGNWNTISNTIVNALVAGDAGFMYAGTKSGQILRCPTNSANSCQVYATLPIDNESPTSILSLAYDPAGNTLYAGTGCKSCSYNFIYSVQLGETGPPPQLVSSLLVSSNSSATSDITDLEFAAGKIWATLSYVEDTNQRRGGVLSCTPSGSNCSYPYFLNNSWGVTYDPDDELIFTSTVPFSAAGDAQGQIQVISAGSGSLGTPINFGSLGNGFIGSSLEQPAFNPNALLYADGYLFVGTGNCDKPACNSLFRCSPSAPGDWTNPSCLQVNLACGFGGGCTGAESLTYIADVNYPY